MNRRPITPALMADLFTGHKTNFQGGFAGAKVLWQLIATQILSGTSSETYEWLGEWPEIREWLGDRVVKELSASTYALKNRTFESTVRVKRERIEDDQMGIYGPMFQEMGRKTAIFPDKLLFALLAAGRTTKCYDGQPFFDTDHPVGPDGAQVSVSNYQAGAGPAWFLLDTSRVLKPLIYQLRREFAMTALDDPRDANVFNRAEFVYGVDGRMEAGYGFWQMAFMSNAELTPANYAAARAAMGSFKSDGGDPLGIAPTLLVFPPALEAAALKILTAENIANETNVWRNTAQPLMAPLLAA